MVHGLLVMNFMNGDSGVDCLPLVCLLVDNRLDNFVNVVVNMLSNDSWLMRLGVSSFVGD